MHATFTHSPSLGILLVRHAYFARAPRLRLYFLTSYFERRLSCLLMLLTLPHPQNLMHPFTTAHGVRLEMALRKEKDLDQYRPGGYHPVHLGDTPNERYMVIRKLGYGK